ncbi:minichromosome maintenance (MCM2/3/5) family protein [Actinidia rufa]|uniref:Minichromosome maintenance (MCM2/3/5) family protein n=1 Tax=Actinidia rufa TaxID=165716 RepID=A0A7J0DVY7_9ERIC|nr:minichromosome maintenance (MCM2/3/5) family protein [Actinidia rufa]
MQETSKEIPAGLLPRSLDVILHQDIVEQARAGDKYYGCDTRHIGISLPRRKGRMPRRLPGARILPVGMKVFDGKSDTNIRNKRKDADEDDSKQFTAEEIDEVQRMRNTPDFFNKLVNSIVPTVFGHQYITLAILLMLLGGVHKITHEGINLRGDINVCIVGDLSCAKSQFLKYASTLVTRSVYTFGKSSSAARLTATVAKNPKLGSFVSR